MRRQELGGSGQPDVGRNLSTRPLNPPSPSVRPLAEPPVGLAEREENLQKPAAFARLSPRAELAACLIVLAAPPPLIGTLAARRPLSTRRPVASGRPGARSTNQAGTIDRKDGPRTKAVVGERAFREAAEGCEALIKSLDRAWLGMALEDGLRGWISALVAVELESLSDV